MDDIVAVRSGFLYLKGNVDHIAIEYDILRLGHIHPVSLESIQLFGVRGSSILVRINHCTAVAARCGNNFGDNLAVIVHNLVAAVIGYCCIRGNDFAVAIRSTVAVRSVVAATIGSVAVCRCCGIGRAACCGSNSIAVAVGCFGSILTAVARTILIAPCKFNFFYHEISCTGCQNFISACIGHGFALCIGFNRQGCCGNFCGIAVLAAGIVIP